MARVAMIGATGLIGRSLAPLLVASGHAVSLYGRRPAGVAGALDRIGPMEDWPAMVGGSAVDIAISTLGSTRKKAGSWAAFEAVDRQAVVGFAAAAKEAGARQMMMVSSVGAAAAAGNRYLALKGQVEDEVAALGFARLDIVRPGLLVGDRGDDRRTGERIAILLSPLINPLLRGGLDQYRAIAALTVAAAMARLAGNEGAGRFVQTNRALVALAGDHRAFS
jgi:uncharacterized protein YbjT (DUF2867 family)